MAVASTGGWTVANPIVGQQVIYFDDRLEDVPQHQGVWRRCRHANVLVVHAHGHVTLKLCGPDGDETRGLRLGDARVIVRLGGVLSNVPHANGKPRSGTWLHF